MSKKSNFFDYVREMFQTEIKYAPREVTVKGRTFWLREIKYEDIKNLIKIERQAYDGEVPWGRSAFLEELNGPNPILYLLAEEQKEAVGFIGVRFTETDGHITNLAVASHYQGLGLGHLFLTEAATVAQEAGYATLSLEVRISNYHAQRLYRRFGFISQKVKQNYYHRNNEDALEMLLLLGGEH